MSDYQRIKVDDKQIINCRADLNQLVPIKYSWAWDRYNVGCANHWMPQEISMAQDIVQWKRTDKLTEQERIIIKRNLGFFSTADSLVANNLVLAVYKLLTNPECRQYLLRQAFEEAVHTHAYQYIIESLGLNEAEVFNMYHEIPCVARKAEWALEYTQSLCDPSLVLDTVESKQRFLRDLIAFYVVFEGIFFYVGFSQILSMARRGLMRNTAEQFQYILRDEINHCEFGIDVINQIIKENPEVWTKQFKNTIYELILEGCGLEWQYAADTMTEDTFLPYKDYVMYITGKRLKQINLGLPKWGKLKNPFPWMDEMFHLEKEKNFFETRVTNYQVGGQLEW